MSPDTLAIMGALLGAADVLSTLVILAGVLQLAGPFVPEGPSPADRLIPFTWTRASGFKMPESGESRNTRSGYTLQRCAIIHPAKLPTRQRHWAERPDGSARRRTGPPESPP